MSLSDRNRSPRRDEGISPWAVAAAIAAAGALAGMSYLMVKPRRKYIGVTSRAYASDGMLLPTVCSCPEEAVCRILVQNAASRSVSGSADESLNEVSTTAPAVAKEVCLHIRVEDGEFDSVPYYENGRPAAHVRTGRELIVFLGDMQPSEEISLLVRVRLGNRI